MPLLLTPDHQELSRSYLVKHWRSGLNSMISQALHNRKTELKIHVLPRCKDLHSSIYSSPDRTLTLFSTGSLLTATKKLSPSLPLSPFFYPLSVLAYPPVFPALASSTSLSRFKFPHRHTLLHHSSMQRRIHSINPAVISLQFHPKQPYSYFPMHLMHNQSKPLL